jgi:hypothetical protein
VVWLEWVTPMVAVEQGSASLGAAITRISRGVDRCVFLG